MSNTGIIDSLLPVIDSILGVRDAVGAVINPIYLVTRTWTGKEVGEGHAKDVEKQMLPSPGIKNYDFDLRLKEGGAIKAGDIILKNVSKNSYSEADLDGTSPARNIEKLYRVGPKMYQVIRVTPSYVTFDIQLRMLTNQTRYIHD